MNTSRRQFQSAALLGASGLLLGTWGTAARAAGAEDLDRDAAATLASLYQTRPVAEVVSKKAKAMLVVPKIVKAGLVFGGSYGEGVLLQGKQPPVYYNSVSASWGWQAGVESYAYVLFLMTDKAVDYLAKSNGWELGVGPSMVIVNEGVGKNLSTTTLKDDAYAFINDQKGLMASLSIEGTKITRIKR